MPNLEVVNFNIVCATLGGFVTVFGLVSYLLKEKFYLSEALISSIFGLLFSPHATNFIRPLDYANGNVVDLETITLYFTRLVLGVQLVLAGVQLPSKYLKKEWKSLSIMLGPGMCIMWMSTSLLVWAMVPGIPFLYAMAVGASVTPTDPILSNGIVKGKFADKNIPPKLQKIIIAESGANDGLGYPFLYLALYLIKFTSDHGAGTAGGEGGKAIALWFYETWVYVIIMSVLYGAAVGWLAKELLHWAEERRYVDRESFLVFAITLALFIVGTVGMLGSDDVLACFIAGNAFTWDDWFRLETEDDSLQPTIDMLLNVAVFMWFGAVCPWHAFVENSVIPIYRLVPLGIMVLLFRRLPFVLAFHKFVHQVEDIRHALFVGFFGPIGVSAIFYLYIGREFLREIEVEGETREDAAKVMEIMNVVIWFLVICSITVHGLSIPLGKLGFYLPRQISTALSTDRASMNRSQQAPDPLEPEPFHVRQHVEHEERVLAQEFRRRRPTTSDLGTAADSKRPGFIPAGLANFGKAIFNDIRRVPNHEHAGATEQGGEKGSGSDSSVNPQNLQNHGGTHPEISGPQNPRRVGRTIGQQTGGVTEDDAGRPDAISEGNTPAHSRVASPTRAMAEVSTPSLASPAAAFQRSIRFPDEMDSAAPSRPRSMAGGPNGASSEVIEMGARRA